MKQLLLVIQLVSSISLIALILLQSSKGGLSGGVGGEPYRTKRGAEKIVFKLTIGIATLFFIISIFNLLLK
jgi:protein translocase SecG subunit